MHPWQHRRDLRHRLRRLSWRLKERPPLHRARRCSCRQPIRPSAERNAPSHESRSDDRVVFIEFPRTKGGEIAYPARVHSADTERYAKHVNPAFVRLLGTFGYGRVLTRARGCTLWDDQDRSYIDMLAAFGAANLGHNPPELLDRMRGFLETDVVNLVHTGPQVHAALLAEDLANLVRPPLEVTLFSNSGGEAVEAALKLARAATGRSDILYAQGGYHGTGLGPLSVMGHARQRQPFEPLVPKCHSIPFDDLDALKHALRAQRPAAFLVEPILAEAGVLIPREGYLAEAQALCASQGCLLVLDEVQTGLGRTGKMFAYEHEGIVPDVLVLGKSLGGSMVPISATMTSGAIQKRAYGSTERFDLHGTTYSGNAFASRTARETLRMIRENSLVEASRVKGDRFLSLLRDRVSGHPFVRDVRGRGLLIGLELGPTDTGMLQRFAPGLTLAVSKKVFGQWLAVRLLELGILCQPASQQWNVLKLEPPLTIDDVSVSRTVDAIVAVLAEYTELGPLVRDVAVRLGSQFKGGWGFR
jgi:putrescine aminotransferase